MSPDPKPSISEEVFEELIEAGTEAFRSVLEKLFNEAMKMERSQFLQASPYERTAQRRGYANGYKGKQVQSRVGELQLSIPQVRGLSFYPKSLEKGCRSEKALKLAIAEMYVMGVSTRKVTEITEQLCGMEISATQVSRLAQMLDDQLEAFRSRPLAEFPVVYLDAHYEKVREAGRVEEVAILTAIGINRFGKREVLAVSARCSEAEVHWRSLLEQLQKRGLSGVRLLVSDDHSGLRQARRSVFPSVPWQRCQFHLSQNAQSFAVRRDEKRVIAADIRDIFNCPTLEDAEQMLARKASKWQNTHAELVDWMQQNLPEGFTVFQFPRSSHKKIRTINGLENLNKQIRRRTRVVGIFPNQASAMRLISAVLAEIHDDWLTGRQYLNLARWKQLENPVPERNYRKNVA
jgi:transposase-like protein